MNNIIGNVIDTTWPMVLVSVVIIVSLRVTYLIKNRGHFVFYQELFKLASIIYVLILFQVVTKQDVVSWSTNNFVPFKEIFRYPVGSRLFLKNVVGNVLLFLPYGFFASYYLKEEKPWLILFLTLVGSCVIETVQMSIGRVFDVDDILLNAIGGLLGFYFYYMIINISKKIPAIFRSEVFLNICSVLILLGLLTLI